MALGNVAIAFVIASLLAACSAGFVKSRPASVSGPSVVEVRADWNDLDAAMQLVVTKAECATVARDELDGGVIRFTLITSTDEDGTLTATPLAPITRESMPIRLECRFGPSGDPSRERLLLDALARRLRQLAGKDWAPAD